MLSANQILSFQADGHTIQHHLERGVTTMCCLRKASLREVLAPAWLRDACSRVSCAAWTRKSPLSNHRSPAPGQNDLQSVAIHCMHLTTLRLMF